MKKYATLSKDLTTLSEEINTYLANYRFIYANYALDMYHPIGFTEDLESDIPSIKNSFTSENLTVKGIGHLAVNNTPIAIPAKNSLLLVPIKDVTSCKLDICEANEGATAHHDATFDYLFYDVEDCTSTTVIENITDPILINAGTINAIVNTGEATAHFAIVSFNEDISSYFAD